VFVAAVLGRSSALPWKRARTLKTPLRVTTRILMFTLLRYVQLDLSVTFLEEIVEPLCWKRTLTLPLQILARPGRWQ